MQFGRKTLSSALLTACLTLMQMLLAKPALGQTARMTYDNQCITIDGKDMVIFSGAFHYFRCPRELWADRFRKLKEAGFNTVETYAAWNWHERTAPANLDDFSKMEMTELNDWLAMATDQFGFQVILRPGPYICAEWDGGGYPQWLITKRPADFTKKNWFRGDDPTYLAWCKHWYTAVARTAAPYQITHRPAGKSGIILWQIENEYSFSDQPVEVKHNQLLFLAHTSRDLGIDVPLTTCMTDNPVFKNDPYLQKNVIETRNTYPKYNMGSMQSNIGVLDRYQPDKFKMITELQGGWFSQVGGELSEAQGFDASHINHITLYAWEHGFTSTNYYMGFGGTNFGDWAAGSITTTYDYDAPLRECGGITERYLAVEALGNFIAEHGTNLARTVPEKLAGTQLDDKSVLLSLRRANDGSRYLFIRTEERSGAREGNLKLTTSAPDALEITAHYNLGPYGAKVLYLPPHATKDSQGQWYPKPVQAPHRPTDLPAAINITVAKMQADSGPTDWKPIDVPHGIESAGIFNCGFVFYRAAIPSTNPLVFSARPSGRDWAGFTLNGKRIVPDPQRGDFVFSPSDAGGSLVGLFENYGRANFGSDMERANGLTDLRFNHARAALTNLTNWRMKRITTKKRPSEMSPTLDDSSWPISDVTQGDGELAPDESAVYRTWITLSDEDLKHNRELVLGKVDDDGFVEVNGKPAGECHDWENAQRLDITQFLHPGKNLIAVLVRNQGGPGGLAHGASLDSVDSVIPAQWVVSDQSSGVVGNWWNPDLDDSAWKEISISDNASVQQNAAPLLTWYRLKFNLPSVDPHQWVPWNVHLDATGNGFLYLNGHPLGRWWQAGPQHDYFLPECWMNFGPGKTNVLTLSLRPTESVGIRSARIEPYTNMAEVR